MRLREGREVIGNEAKWGGLGMIEAMEEAKWEWSAVPLNQ